MSRNRRILKDEKSHVLSRIFHLFNNVSNSRLGFTCTIMPLKIILLMCVSFLLLLIASTSFAQLKVVVHVWGEVENPGEYRVPDGTNILELISKAGGPTEYGNLGKVKLRHITGKSNRVLTVNLKDYLEKESFKPLPTMHNGDVVRISRNTWSKWRTIIKIAADVAIMANVYYWFTRKS